MCITVPLDVHLVGNVHRSARHDPTIVATSGFTLSVWKASMRDLLQRHVAMICSTRGT